MKNLLLPIFTLFSICLFAQTPNLHWAHSFGTDVPTFVYLEGAFTVDNSGNTIAVGNFSGSQDFDPGPGTYTMSTTLGLGYNIYIQKLDVHGSFVWAKQITHTGNVVNNVGYTISDDAGNIYIAGLYNDTTDFDPGMGVSELTVDPVETPHGFILKLDSNGIFQWVNSINGSLSECMTSICVDNDGNVLVGGSYSVGVDFDPGPSVTTLIPSAGNFGVFLLKLDSNGNFIWVKNSADPLNVVGSNGASYIDVDTQNNIYISSKFRDTMDFNPGPGSFILGAAPGVWDVYVQKLDPNGNFIWAKSSQGTSNQTVSEIKVDQSGNPIIIGSFAGTVDFDEGTNSPNDTHITDNDGFILKRSSNGDFLWVKPMNGNDFNLPKDVEINDTNELYVVGNFEQVLEPESGFTLTSNGQRDFYIVKLDSNGLVLWAESFGSSWTDQCFDIELFENNSIFTSGHFTGTFDFDPTLGTTNLSPISETDIFVQKLFNCAGINTTVNNPSGGLLEANASIMNYQWINCTDNLPIPEETNQTFIASVSGEYAVILSFAGCVDTSTCEFVIVSSIIQNGFGKNLTFYPNPTDGNISIGLGDHYTNVTVTVRNMLGQEVINKNYISTNHIDDC